MDTDIHAEIVRLRKEGHEVQSTAMGRVGKIVRADLSGVIVGHEHRGEGYTTFHNGDEVELVLLHNGQYVVRNPPAMIESIYGKKEEKRASGRTSRMLLDVVKQSSATQVSIAVGAINASHRRMLHDTTLKLIRALTGQTAAASYMVGGWDASMITPPWGGRIAFYVGTWSNDTCNSRVGGDPVEWYVVDDHAKRQFDQECAERKTVRIATNKSSKINITRIDERRITR